ncbi:Uncharacterized protein FKW44_017325 [Caligus rogercresseyi]|uniref:Uncharacterized protein n=1 Tax=Caligus rogercresseyi TaxID=217165 RepID=A0A7T8GTA4_CALRO|nr:Uncharacterized protein FKW44_017325 [Caligus rogercresseyi]
MEETVLVQDIKTKLWDKAGTVKQIMESGRSYRVLLDSGKTIVRNRKFIKPSKNHLSIPVGPGARSSDSPLQQRKSPRLSNKSKTVTINEDKNTINYFQ